MGAEGHVGGEESVTVTGRSTEEGGVRATVKALELAPLYLQVEERASALVGS